MRRIQIDVERVVVGDERLGHRAAGDGMHHRRLDFDEAVGVEESPHRLHHLGALQEDLAHVGIHRQVNVAAAVAGLHVLQAVPFFGQGKQVLHQEGDLLHVDGQFVGAGAEEIALDADVVAEVEQLVKLKRFFADVVEADVNLQPLAALLQVGEARFPLHANRHQASGNADVHAWGLKLRPGLGRVLFENLGNGVRGFVAIGIGQLPQRFDLLQLFFSELVDFLVKCHGDSWSAASGEANSKEI